MTGREDPQSGARGLGPATPVVTAPFRLVYGYLRVGDGPPDQVPAQRAAVAAAAEQLGFVLDTVFVDYVARPALQRPSLRVLVDVVRTLRPHGVLIPSPWHLSPWPAERTDLLDQFRAAGCSVLAVGASQTTVLLDGQGVRP